MAISAAALEVFNIFYPQFGWVIKKWSILSWGWFGKSVCCCMIMLTDLSFSFLFVFFLYHRWTDQSRWSQQTVRVEEVLFTLLLSFSSPSPSLVTFPPSFVPSLQTCCLCVSASPLSVPLDDALYLDAGWQRGLAGPSSNQNTLCKQCSFWPPLASSSFLGVSSYARTCTENMRALSYCRGKQVTSFCHLQLSCVQQHESVLTPVTTSNQQNELQIQVTDVWLEVDL